jgi:hypothetical protein
MLRPPRPRRGSIRPANSRAPGRHDPGSGGGSGPVRSLPLLHAHRRLRFGSGMGRTGDCAARRRVSVRAANVLRARVSRERPVAGACSDDEPANRLRVAAAAVSRSATDCQRGAGRLHASGNCQWLCHRRSRSRKSPQRADYSAAERRVRPHIRAQPTATCGCRRLAVWHG